MKSLVLNFGTNIHKVLISKKTWTLISWATGIVIVTLFLTATIAAITLFNLRIR